MVPELEEVGIGVEDWDAEKRRFGVSKLTIHSTCLYQNFPILCPELTACLYHDNYVPKIQAHQQSLRFSHHESLKAVTVDVQSPWAIRHFSPGYERELSSKNCVTLSQSEDPSGRHIQQKFLWSGTFSSRYLIAYPYHDILGSHISSQTTLRKIQADIVKNSISNASFPKSRRRVEFNYLVGASLVDVHRVSKSVRIKLANTSAYINPSNIKWLRIS
ncbi:uncharacterized protein CLUP02_04714 [Colletotrichum lupini]|uniref:Uncharacterized protein n=1 Tax=Colletotrichum lupini TaxID=145971 RepID=A0A9Q8WE16_9PEZI|nr:uncharacterized protein CLUP02_04714 [Colletotrichum lupini]UQC79235.1 hypothetical protein CLUP02_04714 [Colletotrichum lupini]